MYKDGNRLMKGNEIENWKEWGKRREKKWNIAWAIYCNNIEYN